MYESIKMLFVDLWLLVLVASNWSKKWGSFQYRQHINIRKAQLKYFFKCTYVYIVCITVLGWYCDVFQIFSISIFWKHLNGILGQKQLFFIFKLWRTLESAIMSKNRYIFYRQKKCSYCRSHNVAFINYLFNTHIY